MIQRPPIVQTDTQKYYDRYDSLYRVLDENPNVLDAIDKDIGKSAEGLNSGGRFESTQGTSSKSHQQRVGEILVEAGFAATGVRLGV